MQDDMTLTGVKLNNVISKDSVFLARCSLCRQCSAGSVK